MPPLLFERSTRLRNVSSFSNVFALAFNFLIGGLESLSCCGTLSFFNSMKADDIVFDYYSGS